MRLLFKLSVAVFAVLAAVGSAKAGGGQPPSVAPNEVRLFEQPNYGDPAGSYKLEKPKLQRVIYFTANGNAAKCIRSIAVGKNVVAFLYDTPEKGPKPLGAFEYHHNGSAYQDRFVLADSNRSFNKYWRYFKILVICFRNDSAKANDNYSDLPFRAIVRAEEDFATWSSQWAWGEGFFVTDDGKPDTRNLGNQLFPNVHGADRVIFYSGKYAATSVQVRLYDNRNGTGMSLHLTKREGDAHYSRPLSTYSDSLTDWGDRAQSLIIWWQGKGSGQKDFTLTQEPKQPDGGGECHGPDPQKEETARPPTGCGVRCDEPGWAKKLASTEEPSLDEKCGTDSCSEGSEGSEFDFLRKKGASSGSGGATWNQTRLELEKAIAKGPVRPGGTHGKVPPCNPAGPGGCDAPSICERGSGQCPGGLGRERPRPVFKDLRPPQGPQRQLPHVLVLEPQDSRFPDLGQDRGQMPHPPVAEGRPGRPSVIGGPAPSTDEDRRGRLIDEAPAAPDRDVPSAPAESDPRFRDLEEDQGVLSPPRGDERPAMRGPSRNDRGVPERLRPRRLRVRGR